MDLLKSRRPRMRSVALLVAGIMAGSVMLQPAVAHVTRRLNHLFRHLDPRYINVGEKASDSDRLDGLDSTAFLRTTGKAADADLLDGNDSAVFLNARGRAAMGRNTAFVPLSSTFTTLASVTVTIPPGANQVVSLDGEASVFGASASCPCNINMVITGPGTSSDIAFDQIDRASSSEQVHVERGWLTTAAPGTHTYNVQVAVFQAAAGQFQSTSAAIRAETFPLSGAGAAPRGALSDGNDATASGQPA